MSFEEKIPHGHKKYLKNKVKQLPILKVTENIVAESGKRTHRATSADIARKTHNPEVRLHRIFFLH